jgi:acetyl esterase/lipase
MRAACIAIAVAMIAATPAAAQAPARMTPAQVTALPHSEPYIRASYGFGPIQVGELREPPGKGPFPVAVIIHGGCWTKGFATMAMTSAMATALQAKGFATWNIEYRQLGEDGAGFPGTFQDWGMALDHLRVLAKSEPIDLKRVIVVGHSAGGHAALWLAARPGLPKGSPLRGDDPLPVTAAVDIDGPADLQALRPRQVSICRAPVADNLMGGDPASAADRWSAGDPARRLPLHVHQLLVSSVVLTAADADTYAKAARAAGDKVDVLNLVDTGHHEPVAPGTPAWTKVEAFIVENALK